MRMMERDSKTHPSEFLEFKSVADPSAGHDGIRKDEEKAAAADNIAPVPPSDGDSAFQYLPRRGSVVQEATEKERHMTLSQALRMFPKAIGWSCMISMAIIMEGFDTALIGSFYAFTEFQRSYGEPTGDGGYQVSTMWQSILSNGSTAGSVVGLFANGLLTEYFGYRKTMIGALIALAAFISLSFAAANLPMLLAGQILCGISWGVFSTLTTTYAAEVMPLALRGYLIASVNTCWLIGQIVAAGTLRGLIDMESTWSYRIPFGVQWVWIFIIIIGSFFAPESPWWLIKKGRTDQAKRALLRLIRRDSPVDIDGVVAMMAHTNEAEKQMSQGTFHDLSYMECFRGVNRRRTEIACMVFMIQNLSGLPIIGFAAYFYQQIGFDQQARFNLTLGMQGAAIFGACVSLVLMKYFGRRQLYLAGIALQFTILLIAGIINSFQETPQTLWATAALIFLFIFVYDCALGPITYTLVAEIPSTRLRVKTVVLARVSYNICCLVTNVIQQHMLSPLSWDWRGKSCYFWAGSCVFCFIYCFWRLPETKGLTYLELDVLFAKGASARKFKKFQEVLARSGYFEIVEQGLDSPNWREPRSP